MRQNSGNVWASILVILCLLACIVFAILAVVNWAEYQDFQSDAKHYGFTMTQLKTAPSGIVLNYAVNESTLFAMASKLYLATIFAYETSGIISWWRFSVINGTEMWTFAPNG
jgi:hypothetical protein